MGGTDYWDTQPRLRLRRRRLLRNAAVGGAGLSALAVAACGGGNNGGKANSGPASATAARPAASAPTGPAAATRAAATPGAAGSVAAATATPKRGGIAVTTYQYDPPTLDLHASPPAQAEWFQGGIYSGLMKFSWKQPWTIAPDLAEKWETPDPQTFTFHIRSGVKWSDGSDFSPSEILFNLEKVLSPAIAPKSAYFGAAMSAFVESATQPDPNTISIKTKSPFPALMTILAGNNAKIFKQSIYEKDQQEQQFIGTGPFAVKQYLKSQVFEWARNPHYFKPGLPYLDGVQFRAIPAVPAEVSALSTGQVMVNPIWPAFLPSQVDVIRKAVGDKATIVEFPENSLEKIFVNLTKPPFNDKRVRQAVNLALNRQEIVNRALEKAGTIAILDPAEVGDYAISAQEVAKLPGFRPNKDEDIANAKKLLEAAGYPQGLDFEFLVRQAATYVPIAQVAVESLAKAGLRAKLNQVESSAGVVQQNQGKFEMGVVGPGSTWNDPFLSVLKQYVLGSGEGPYAGLKDPNIVDVVNKGHQTTDQAERKKLAQQAQKYIATEDTGYFAVAWDTSAIIQWKKLRDYYPAQDQAQMMDFEAAWLES